MFNIKFNLFLTPGSSTVSAVSNRRKSTFVQTLIEIQTPLEDVIQLTLTLRTSQAAFEIQYLVRPTEHLISFLFPFFFSIYVINSISLNNTRYVHTIIDCLLPPSHLTFYLLGLPFLLGLIYNIKSYVHVKLENFKTSSICGDWLLLNSTTQ